MLESDSDSPKELSDSDADFAEDALESDFVTASEVEQEEPNSAMPVQRLPYKSISDMPETNAREKWYKEWITEIFVPAVADGDVEEGGTMPEPTWSDSDTEDEAPPEPKPRPITKTEMKRAQVKAQILVGTPTKVIMETLKVSADLVYRVMKMMRENPDPDDERDMAVKPRPGRPRKRCPELLLVLKNTFKEDPMVHYSTVAKRLGVSKMTVSRGVSDLGMKSYVMRYRALISSKAMVKRVERSEELLEWISAHPDTVILFSDKKASPKYSLLCSFTT